MKIVLNLSKLLTCFLMIIVVLGGVGQTSLASTTVTITSPSANGQFFPRQALPIRWTAVSRASYRVSLRNLTTNRLLIDNLNVNANTSYTIPVNHLVVGSVYRVAVGATVSGTTKWAERTFRIQDPSTATLTVSPTSWSPSAAAGNKTIYVTSNTTWNVPTSNKSWLTISNITPTNRTGNGSFRLNASANTGAQRSATITITNSALNITRTISVEQAAKQVTITWNANGHGAFVSPGSQSKAVGTTFGSLPTPVRNGIQFMGWFTVSGATGGAQITSSSIVPSANTTYYARWRQYTHTIDNRFDSGYRVHYGNETAGMSSNNINAFTNSVATRYLELFNLNITRNNATEFRSLVDACKGITTTANLNNRCTAHGNFCTVRQNVATHYSNAIAAGSCRRTRVLWSAHGSWDTAGGNPDNRSCSWGPNDTPAFVVMITRQDNTTDRVRNSQSVLMHEMNHQLGARDHYHELADPTNPRSCKNRAICSYCDQPNARHAACIMNNSARAITNAVIICGAASSNGTVTGCWNEIISHLRSNHT